MTQRQALVTAEPGLVAVFATLEAHWPTLINGIESDLIPRTNNTVELVIRRFDQHYQNMCGFESVETASVFLGVFEKVYRFTPFSRMRSGGCGKVAVGTGRLRREPDAHVVRLPGVGPALPTQPSTGVVPNEVRSRLAGLTVSGRCAIFGTCGRRPQTCAPTQREALDVQE